MQLSRRSTWRTLPRRIRVYLTTAGWRNSATTSLTYTLRGRPISARQICGVDHMASVKAMSAEAMITGPAHTHRSILPDTPASPPPCSRLQKRANAFSSRHVVILKLHLIRGGLRADQALAFKALAAEVQAAGYHFYILHERVRLIVRRAPSLLWSGVWPTQPFGSRQAELMLPEAGLLHQLSTQSPWVPQQGSGQCRGCQTYAGGGRADRPDLLWQVTQLPLTATEMLQLLPAELHAFSVFHNFEEPLYGYKPLRDGVERHVNEKLGPGNTCNTFNKCHHLLCLASRTIPDLISYGGHSVAL